MGLSPQQIAELHDLLWGLRAGTATPQQVARLERLVCEDPEVRRSTSVTCTSLADLHWNSMARDESKC